MDPSKLSPDDRTAYESMTPEQQLQYAAHVEQSTQDAYNQSHPKPTTLSSGQFDQYSGDLEQDPSYQKMEPWQQEQYKNYVRDHYVSNNSLSKAGNAVIHGAGTALDALGGTVRSTAAAVTGQHRDGDFQRILGGNAPRSDEILARMGVSNQAKLSDALPSLYSETGDGLSFKRGGVMDPTARGTLGTILDIATDPLTYLTAGGSAAGKAATQEAAEIGAEQASKSSTRQAYEAALKRADKSMVPMDQAEVPAMAGEAATEAPQAPKTLREKLQDALGQSSEDSPTLKDKLLSALQSLAHPFGAATSATGENIYRSGFKAVDRAARKVGKDPVSDVFLDNGVWGTNSSMMDQAEDVASKYEEQVNALQKQADDQGAKVDLRRATDPAYQYLQELRGKNLHGMADDLQGLLERYYQPPTVINSPEGKVILGETVQGRIPTTNASNWKTGLYNLIGDSGYQQYANTPAGKEFLKKLAYGLKSGVEDSANAVQSGLGDQIAKTNDLWGRVLSTRKELEKEAWKGESKNWITSVDPMLGAIMSGSGAPGMEGALLAKKAADAAKTGFVRSGTGLGLYKLGNNQAANVLANRAYINAVAPSANPWLLLNAKEQQDGK